MTDCQLLLDAIPLPVLRLPPTTMFTSMTDCCNSNTYPHLSFLVGCNSNNTRITRITITGTQPQPAWTLSPNIGKLNALTSLVISNVGLSGDLPDAFSDMPELEDINFSKGNLTGPFPSSFSRLTNLQTLRMDENAITGPLPPVWGQALKRLSLLSLQQNKIAGGIPTEWSGLTSLRSLDLSKNFLKDSITPLANLTSLTSIVLSVNSFEGTLSSFIPMKKLSNLQVSFNLLTGAIPTLGDGSSSFYLFVDNNFLRGRIPDFVYDLNNVRLTQNCFLNGDIDRSRFKVKSNSAITIRDYEYCEFYDLDEDLARLKGLPLYAKILIPVGIVLFIVGLWLIMRYTCCWGHLKDIHKRWIGELNKDKERKRRKEVEGREGARMESSRREVERG